jgi:DNA-binding NarL/FixJ family response regulator
LDHVLLERDSEVDSVTACLRGAVNGRGALVVISGPLGSGKSRLLHALPAHATSETVVLRASGALEEQDFAFGVVHQFLDSALLVALPEARDQWLSVTPEGKALETLYGLVVGLSARHPLLVLVDDLQWADAPSLAWLERLTNELGSHRIVVVLTVSEGEPTAENAAVLEILGRADRKLALNPFSPAATAQAIAAEFDRPGEDGFVRGCHEAFGGRPLFLMSVLAELRLRGYHPIAEHTAVARSIRPTALLAQLTACLRSQSAPTRRFAQTLAALNEPDSRELLAPISGLGPDELAAAAETLATLGLLAPGPVLRFFHHTVRDAVEQSISPGQFAELHFRLAEALRECGSPVDEIAAHLVRAEPRPLRWAAEALRAAGGAAAGRGDADSAARYLRRALMNCPDEDRGRAQLLIDLATTERRFDPLLSAQHLAEALPLFDSAIERGHAAVRIEPMMLGLRQGAAFDLMEKLHGELGDPATATEESREMALRLEARLRYAKIKDPPHLADAAQRLAGLGDDPPLGTVGERELAGALLFAVTLSGTDLAAVATLGGRILRGDPPSLDQMHTATPLIVRSLITADSLSDASAWLDLAAAEERRLGVPSLRTFIDVQRALIAVRRGRHAEAADFAFHALDLISPSAQPSLEQGVHALVLLAMDTGDAALAARALARCAEHESEIHSSWLRKLMHGAAAATTGNAQVALKYFHAAGRNLDSAGWRNPEIVPWRGWAAMLHFRLGQHAAARELADEEYTRARAWRTPQGQGRSLRVRGAITPGAAGIELLTRSAEVLAESENPVERARTALLLGERLRDSGHPDAAAHLARATRPVAERDAAWLVLPDTRPPAVPASSRTSLTASERKVAELAVSGMTNQLIARQLGITVRTVEKHLTNCYRKLGVDGRTDLSRALNPPPPE